MGWSRTISERDEASERKSEWRARWKGSGKKAASGALQVWKAQSFHSPSLSKAASASSRTEITLPYSISFSTGPLVLPRLTYPHSATACSTLRGLAASRATVVHLARSLGIVASVLDCGSVSIIRVDASQLTTIDSSHTFNVNIALALLRAVAAGAVQLAIVIDIEVLAQDQQKSRKYDLLWRDSR